MGGGIPYGGSSMTHQFPWVPCRINRGHPFWVSAVQRKRARVAARNLYVHGHISDAGPVDDVIENWDRFVQASQRALAGDVVRPLTEADLAVLRPAQVPVFCEWLLCLAVEPEFQDDRLADYQEQFADLWVPKFGPRFAAVMYVWHVLRQSRLIDWLIRAFGWGDLL